MVVSVLGGGMEEYGRVQQVSRKLLSFPPRPTASVWYTLRGTAGNVRREMLFWLVAVKVKAERVFPGRRILAKHRRPCWLRSRSNGSERTFAR
ncbi:hypothetical protein E2C01_077084 [Portunus trituberculatus]|uniref:Uncharacterized protein n=1 Tax=Portunus trituberculatus TaxID=210409 RepID=A0A5B7IKT6_PORTR|nr:hypothetical protein [Portunus trituberculatus]